jgi:pimeloyl-ACP methyl ester carboxylesterase
MRQGGGGFADDFRVHASPWGFDLGAITVEVRILQGSEDTNVPPSHARWLAANIPGSTLTVLDGEGHMSLAINHSLAFGQALVDGPLYSAYGSV